MPKAIVVDPKVVRKPGKIEFPALPVNQYARGPQERGKEARKEAPRQDLRGHAVHPRVRVHAGRDQDPGGVPGHQVQLQGAGPPVARAGVGRGRPVPAPERRRLHLRLAPQPRRDPGQVLLGHRQAGRGRPDRSHEELPGRAHAGRRGEGRRRRGQGPGRGLRAVRHAGGDLRPGDRLQPRHGRLDARLLRALRLHAQQRHRGRLRGHRGGRGPVQADQPPARDRGRQHRRRLLGLRPGVGGHRGVGHGPVPHALGQGDRAAPRRSCSTSSTTSTAWAGSRKGRPWASASSRAWAPGSTPRPCTPSGWTATTRWPWPTPSSARRRSCWRAAARCSWT